MMYYINLDPPSEDIITECRIIASQKILSEEKHAKNFHDSNYSVNYAHTGCFTSPYLRDAMREQYQLIFKWTLSASIVMIENHSKYPIASFGKHIDSTRCAGINWYLELGSSDPRMTFYNSYGNVGSSTTVEKLYHTEEPNDQEIECQYKIEINKWYSLNAQQYHSGENIETKRLILVSRFENSVYEEFIELYKHMLHPVPKLKNTKITYLKELQQLYG